MTPLRPSGRSDSPSRPNARTAPRKRRHAALAAALMWLAPAAARTQESRYNDADYLAIVDRYAAGERAEATAALSHWNQRELARAVEALRARALRPCTACLEPVQLKAAVMLHTDREEVERRLLPASDESQPTCSGGIHAGLARKAVELLLETPGGRDFARRWLFGMALRDQQAFCLANALRWADDGVRWFANDAELLLARGTIQEALATLVGSVPGLAGLSPRARDMARSTLNERRYRLAGARRSFESALAADPGLHEARLRLGRVAWHLEQKDAARSAFESVLSRAAEPGVLYLARLYLGRVAEDARRLEEAEGHYREALALEPQGQAAAVALSHVLGLAGDPAAAREVLEAAVSRAGSRTLADPFWAYLSGRSDEGDAILDELRRESHR